MTDSDDDVVELPVDGCLDLHTFHPSDLGGLIPDYLAECRKRGIYEVRIVHGKGRGQIRRSVEAILGRTQGVAAWRPAHGEEGAWGATMVSLAEPAPNAGESDEEEVS